MVRVCGSGSERYAKSGDAIFMLSGSTCSFFNSGLATKSALDATKEHLHWQKL